MPKTQLQSNLSLGHRSTHKPTEIPYDILLLIVEALIPIPDANIQIAIPRSHPFTKTLVALSRVNRATYPIATKYLYTRCVFVETYSQLHQLVDTLVSEQKALGSSPKAALIKSLRLELVDIVNMFHRNPVQIANIQAIISLFTLLSPNLQRLLVDIRTHSLFNNSLLPVMELKQAFCSLKHLEEFYSLSSSLFLLTVGGHNIWTYWPRLRILGLNGMPGGYAHDSGVEWIWQELFEMPCLETFIEIYSGDSQRRRVWLEGLWTKAAVKRSPTFVFVSSVGEDYFRKEYTTMRVKRISLAADGDVYKLCAIWAGRHSDLSEKL